MAGQYRVEKHQKNVSGCIAAAGGSYESHVTDRTTHVVASEKAWKRKDANVAKALDLNANGGRDIKIVSFDWLEDTATNKSRKKEGPYLWEKLDASLQKRDAAHRREEKAKEPKSHVGMLKEVFDESTEKYVDERTRKKLDKQLELQKRAEQEVDEEEAKRERREAKKKAEAFGKGAKKARNELFTGKSATHFYSFVSCNIDRAITEDHHIYQDETGFKYDVILTKVDTRQNRNERYALTVSAHRPRLL